MITKEDAPTFTEEELKDLNEFVDAGGKVMAHYTQTSLFLLYLEGRTIKQLHEAYPQWSAGALLLARYTYRWDKQKDDDIVDLMNQLRSRLLRVKLESVRYLLDQISVNNKQFAKQMEDFLRDPNGSAPPDNRIATNKEYRETLKALQEAMTLGDKTASSNSPVQVNVLAGEGTTIQITSKEQSEILETLATPKKLPEPK
jgi:hypothetical protein